MAFSQVQWNHEISKKMMKPYAALSTYSANILLCQTWAQSDNNFTVKMEKSKNLEDIFEVHIYNKVFENQKVSKPSAALSAY